MMFLRTHGEALAVLPALPGKTGAPRQSSGTLARTLTGQHARVSCRVQPLSKD